MAAFQAPCALIISWIVLTEGLRRLGGERGEARLTVLQGRTCSACCVLAAALLPRGSKIWNAVSDAELACVSSSSSCVSGCSGRPVSLEAIECLSVRDKRKREISTSVDARRLRVR